MDLSRFVISGSKRRIEDAIEANRRLIKVRWYYAAAMVLIVAFIVAAIGNLYDNAILYLLILVAVYALNGVLLLATYWCKRSLIAQRIIMAMQITLDLAMAVSTVAIQGGIDARTTLLFATPVIAAGLMFTHKAVYIVAIAAGIAYSASVIVYELMAGGSIDLEILLVPVLTYPIILIAQAKLANYLAQANQNEVRAKAHEEFLSMISHQLRHPISVSSTIIDVVNTSADELSPEMQHKIGMLKGENEDMLRTINNLLAFAGRGKKQRIERVDVRKILKSSARRIGNATMRESDVAIDVGDTPMYVQGDEYKLELLFTNIIDNALRYSEAGSPVRVQLTKAESSTVRCTIIDHGQGMSDAQITAAMKQPYNFRSRKADVASVSGLNLGLYVSQEIAHTHGGSVTINSDNNQTTAVIELQGMTQ